MNTELIIILFTSLSFFVYGVNSFVSKRMKQEYERWGFGSQRKLIGCSQILCSIGLIIGIKIILILKFSALCLIAMMTFAIITRIKVKDNISEILPAASYFVLSVLILLSN